MSTSLWLPKWESELSTAKSLSDERITGEKAEQSKSGRGEESQSIQLPAQANSLASRCSPQITVCLLQTDLRPDPHRMKPPRPELQRNHIMYDGYISCMLQKTSSSQPGGCLCIQRNLGQKSFQCNQLLNACLHVSTGIFINIQCVVISSTGGVVLVDAYHPWDLLECGKQDFFSSSFPVSHTRLLNRKGPRNIQCSEMNYLVLQQTAFLRINFSNAWYAKAAIFREIFMVHTGTFALLYSVLGWHKHWLSCNRSI